MPGGLDSTNNWGTGPRPHWSLCRGRAGSGAVTGTHPGASAPTTSTATSDGQPLQPNRAVLLHGKTGAIIAVQDKRYGFTILPTIKDDYGLSAAPDVQLDEGIAQGKRLTIVESRLGRVAILICEASGLTPSWQRLLGVAGGGLLIAAGAANLAIADGSTVLFVGLPGFAAWLVWLTATGVRLVRSNS